MHTRHGGRVLVIDDCVDAADALVLRLRAGGLGAMARYTADAGWQAAQAWRPRVVVIEPAIRGASLDGLQLARLLGQQPDADWWLVALGASPRSRDRDGALDAGFDAYLVKADMQLDLVERIRAWMTTPRPVMRMP